MSKWIWLLLGSLLPIFGCTSKSDSQSADSGTLSPTSAPTSTLTTSAVSESPSQSEIAASGPTLTTGANPPTDGQLNFLQYTLPADADAKGIIDFLGKLDRGMQDLLRAAGSPKLSQDEAARQARVLSDIKLEAAERLDAKAESQLHKELALLAKMEALSHAAGLGDSKSAAILRELASQTSSIESKLVAHQAAIVLLGFELSDLAAGLTDAQPVLNQLDQILDDRSSLKLPDFHVCAQTLKVLQQHGLEQAYASAKKKTIEAFSGHAEPQLAMRLWYLEVGSTPEFTALSEAMNDDQGSLVEFQKALTAVEALSSTQWTLGYLLQNFTQLEFTGQLDKVGVISSFIEDRIDWIKIPELRNDAEKLVEGYRKRLSTIGKPFSLEGLVTVPNGQPLDPASLKGKVVLLDFWASWCPSCRAEFPNLRELYSKYHERGFEIVGVNVDDNRDDMLNLLKADPLPWIHVRAANPSLLGFENPLAKELGLTGIPFLMLIGADGNTIAIQTRGLTLARLLAERFP